MTVNWLYLSPRLAEAGYCVWALDLPDRARAPIADQASALRRFVGKVRKLTGARRVSIIGHSIGGTVARYYIRFLSGRKKVDDLISLGTPHKGYVSTEEGKPIDDLYNTGCASCVEQGEGSELITRLNRGDMSPGRVSYTQIGTVHDEFVGDVNHVFLDPDKRVSNIMLQDRCPDHFVDHLLLAADDLVYQWIHHALRARGPADPSAAVTCPAY